MPELPEVETVRAELELHITGKTISEIDKRRDNIRIAIPDLSVLHGKKISRIERRAKYLIIHFAKYNDALVIHLGMSGKILLGTGLARKNHDHVIFHFTDNSEMVFNDARRFGVVTLLSQSAKLFNHLGPEPFSDEFNFAYLNKSLKNRKTPIKVAILDQALVVGVGNIYASEALFRSRINPKTPANKVRELSGLIKNIRAVLQDSIDAGGSTLRDYRQTSGRIGKFQHKFDVYGKTNKPCPRCGTLITQITQAGRSTFYCQNCQKQG